MHNIQMYSSHVLLVIQVMYYMLAMQQILASTNLLHVGNSDHAVHAIMHLMQLKEIKQVMFVMLVILVILLAHIMHHPTHPTQFVQLFGNLAIL